MNTKELNERLEVWASDRSISLQTATIVDYVANITEENGEWLAGCKANDQTEMIDAVADKFIFTNVELLKFTYDINDQIFFTNDLAYIKAASQTEVLSRNEFNLLIVNNLGILTNLNEQVDGDIFIGVMKAINRKCVTQMIAMGYDHRKVFDEVLKVIESRVGAWSDVHGKWMKDTSPEAQAHWYTPDYSKCKLKGVLL